jgi:glutamyl-Q tRNA(Asp) synthetase
LAVPPRYRGRFAPSPTGPLHFGSLIAALASYCDARARGGEWLVRIEDVDAPRARRGASSAILATLERYGFAWDGPVLRQSARTDRYAEALRRLAASGLAYPCACTRRELEAAAQGAGGERIYPGTCRDGIAPRLACRPQRSWRARVTGAAVEASIAFRDRLLGAQMQDVAAGVGDFVVMRADGLFAYQLAVVVDDAEQGVNAVVRGADLLASTPRQIWLQRALGFPTPSYLHVPVAIDGGGRKLSKQTGAAPLPADPLPALLAAWRLLDQPELALGSAPSDAREFWAAAIPAWSPSRLPPVAMLPAPTAFRPGSPEPV